jgi:hypothetical protein
MSDHSDRRVMIEMLLMLGNNGRINRLRDLKSRYLFVGVDMASNSLPAGLVTTPCRMPRLSASLLTVFYVYVDRLKLCCSSDNCDV